MRQNREFTTKLDRLLGLLEREGLYAVYLKRQDNFAWLTCGGINYVAVGDMGNCGLLVTLDGLHAVTTNIEAPRMREEEKLEEMGFSLHAGVWHDREFEERTLCAICGEKPLARDYGPGNRYEDIQKLRFSLTPEEIERYQEGGAIVSRLVEETAAILRPGETEWSVTARVAARAREEGLEIMSLFCGSDERIYRYRHAIATDKKIRERVQMGGNMRYKGLVICLTRYVNFVPVSQELKKQYLDNVRIDCEMIAASRPGETYQTPLLAAQKAYEELGYPGEFDKHHQGGPIGYIPRDYRVDFSHHGVIAENQAFCWNPSITGTKSEDTVISTADGPLFVSRPYLFPRVELHVAGRRFVRADILEKY